MPLKVKVKEYLSRVRSKNQNVVFLVFEQSFWHHLALVQRENYFINLIIALRDLILIYLIDSTSSGNGEFVFLI